MPVQDTIVLKDGSVHHVIILADNRAIFHCEDGPAVEWANGGLLWYLNGHSLPFAEWLVLTPISDEEKLMLKLIYG